MRTLIIRFLFFAFLILTVTASLAIIPNKHSSQKGAIVKGILIERNTLKPLKGRQILLCKVEYGQEGKRIMTITVDFNCDTDSRGHFYFSHVPIGKYGLISIHMMQRSDLMTSDGINPIDVVVKSTKQSIDLGKIPLENP